MESPIKYSSTRDPGPSAVGPFLKKTRFSRLGALYVVAALLAGNAYVVHMTRNAHQEAAYRLADIAASIEERLAERLDFPAEMLNPAPGIIPQPSRDDEIEQAASAVLEGGDLLERAAAKAYVLHLDGKTDEAVARLTGIAKALDGVADDRAADAWYRVGTIRQATDDHRDSIRSFDEAIRLSPQHAEALNNRGIEFARLGDYEKALADFAAVIELRPYDFYAYYNRAYMAAERGDYNSAIADYDVAVELAPDNAVNHRDRGITLAQLGRIQDARMAFSAALNLADSSGNRQLADEIRQLLSTLVPN